MHPQVVIFVLGPFVRVTCCMKRHDFAFGSVGSNGILTLRWTAENSCEGRSRKRAPVAIVMTKHDSQVARGCYPWLLPLPAIRGCSPWLLRGNSLAIPWLLRGSSVATPGLLRVHSVSTLRRYPPSLPSVATFRRYPLWLPSVATLRGYPSWLLPPVDTPRGYPVASLRAALRGYPPWRLVVATLMGDSAATD